MTRPGWPVVAASIVILLSCLAAGIIVGIAWYFAADAPRTGDGVASYLPASGDEVVEQLPAQSTASKRDLRERLAASAAPGVATAVSMARRHYDRARSEGDPRELGLAQAALGRWWSASDAPAAVLIMRAAIRQHQHDFHGALLDLGMALRAEPGNIQALLSQAAIQQTLGRLGDAERSCARVLAVSDQIAGHVCLADLASLKGDPEAFDRIRLRLDQLRPGAAERGWVLTLMAEMAERLGRSDDAEPMFKRAIEADMSSYARVAYADFLLLRSRGGEVEALLRSAPATDAVLLRRAIALHRLGDARAMAQTEALRRRFQAASQRADSVHLREMARFALEIDGDADGALALAKRNWSLQKEPADALLLAGAARAAGLAEEAEPVRDFARDPGLADVRLAALL